MSWKKKWSDNAFFILFAKTWRYAQNNRPKVALFWSLFVIVELVVLFFTPLLWAQMMNVIQQHGITNDSIKTLLGLLLLTLGVDVFFWALHGPARVMECENAFQVRKNYRSILLKGVMTLPLEWHTDHHSGDTIDKVEKGTTALYQFSEDSFEVVYALVRLIGSTCILAYFSNSSLVIVGGMIGITAWIIMRFDSVLVEQYQRLNRYENKISESVFDAISNITTVVILRVEMFVFKAIMSCVEEPFPLFQRNVRMNELKWFLVNICCNITTILVLSAYFFQHIGATTSVLIGNVYLLIKYLENISNLFFRFAQLYGDTVMRKAKVMNAEELTQDFVEENFANHVLPAQWEKIEVRNLNFSYSQEGEEELHLEDVSFSVFRGQRIAFIGMSGSGKTTCMKIMRDLYHPQNIELRVDGHLMREGFAGISRACSLVPQTAEIFATTILGNITLGVAYNETFVRCFTDMACFTDVVERLPRGFSSSIREKGVNLSGGERQRLALSRGLCACHDKEIILLDEPTNNLDAVNELDIYRNIFREFHGKTIVSSVHRLHLLPLFDRIYLFDGGRVIAHGTFEQLLEQCELFRDMVQHSQDRKMVFE